MKTISASILALGLFAGVASAKDIFTDINQTAPKGLFDQIRDSAPRSVWTDLNDSAPRSVFDDINSSAPRTDGVFGTVQGSAP